VNVSDVTSQEDVNERVATAAFFGTLQAGFTDFHYLRPIWQKTTQKDALLGIGMTGIGSGEILKYDLDIAAHVAKPNDLWRHINKNDADLLRP
jgi:ribonucleoside-diphosphate reductase alpha chain